MEQDQKQDAVRIDVNLKVNYDAWKPDVFEQDHKETTLATAWVEIGNLVRFPVSMKKYRDRKDNKMKWFISYPQKKKGESYENMVYPSSMELRQQIEKAVGEKLVETIMPNRKMIPVRNVRISLLKPERTGSSVVDRGVASIELGGLTINGIMVKEGKNGLFIQMPQYRSTDGWKDSIYAIDRVNQKDIQREVLYAYGKAWLIKEYALEQRQGILSEEIERAALEISCGIRPENIKLSIPPAAEAAAAIQSEVTAEAEKEQEVNRPEITTEQQTQGEEKSEVRADVQTEDKEEAEDIEEAVTPDAPELLPAAEAVEMFLAAYDAGDHDALMTVSQHSKFALDEPEYYADGSLILQNASMSDGKTRITLAFANEYDTDRPWREGSKVSITIYMLIELSKGNRTEPYKYMDMTCKTKEEADQAYAALFECWNTLTRQEIPPVRPDITAPVPEDAVSVGTDPERQQPRL